MPPDKIKGNRSGFQQFATTWGGTGLLVLTGFIVAYQFVQPAPPDQISIATGNSDGAYYHYARQYQGILARDGITLELVETAGSLENLEKLDGEDGGVDLAIVQGAIPAPPVNEAIESIGSLFFEPVWILARDTDLPALVSAWKGRRVAIGPQGSGTHFVARKLLHSNGIDEQDATLVSEALDASASDLLDGRVDVLFMVTAADSPLLRKLIGTEGVDIVDLQRARGYARVNRSLSAVELPEGTLDFEHNLPPKDVGMIAVTANLLAREDIHPALVDLLIEAAVEVHGRGGFFDPPGTFPSSEHNEFPLNPEAERHYEYGPPFLQRYLPFWAATLVDRLKIMLLPLLGLLIPLVKVMPPVFRWRIRKRIYRWYSELQQVDIGINEAKTDEGEADYYLQELDRIEREAGQITVPLSYADQLYNLRLHIKMIREKALALRELQGGAHT
ncbi:MAG: TAXI family TRAP transporter solute-binding subunit [Pseudomonadota bacterium]|nr:TAXI family TRAP transporter solute-binding subunit [Pseudomonadota bacterium]